MRLAAGALLLVALAAPAATAADWVAPADGAVLGAIELVHVRAAAGDTPVLLVDADAGAKGAGQALVDLECDAQGCLWQALLDTRALPAGAHTLTLSGVADPPPARQVTVDNARTVERLAVWKDPYNPWPTDVRPGEEQRRLFWVANLGSAARTIRVQADADGLQDLRLVEVTTNNATTGVAAFRLEPGWSVHVQLTGVATDDDGQIVVRASTDEASARLQAAFGDGPTPRGTPSPGLALLAPLAAAAAGWRRRTSRGST